MVVLGPLRQGSAGADGFVSIAGDVRLQVKYFGRHTKGNAWIVQGITWDGHEFLDAARNDGLWAGEEGG